MTQAQLAARAGIARPLLSDYERGAVQPTVPAMLMIEQTAATWSR